MLLDDWDRGSNNKDKTSNPPEASRKWKLRLSNRLSRYRDEISIDGLSGIDASGVDRQREVGNEGRKHFLTWMKCEIFDELYSTIVGDGSHWPPFVIKVRSIWNLTLLGALNESYFRKCRTTKARRWTATILLSSRYGHYWPKRAKFSLKRCRHLNYVWILNSLLLLGCRHLYICGKCKIYKISIIEYSL